MSVSIMVVDDEPDVAELFRQRFRHEVRQGQYVMHFAASAEDPGQARRGCPARDRPPMDGWGCCGRSSGVMRSCR